MKKNYLILWKDYGLNKDLSWHIPYAMKLWNNYSKQGFVGILVRKGKNCGLVYVRVGENHVASGDQGRAFMVPWERWEPILKPSLGQFHYSFGSIVVGGMHDLGSSDLTLHGARESSYMGEL